MAANPGAYPPPNFGAMPSLMHGALGLAAGVQQPLLPGHFGLLQPQGPSQQPLHPMEGVSEGFPLVMPGPSLTDHPIMQPPIVLEQAHQGAGQNAEWPPGALQGVPVQEQNEDGTNRSSPPPSGAWYSLLTNLDVSCPVSFVMQTVCVFSFMILRIHEYSNLFVSSTCVVNGGLPVVKQPLTWCYS